jgi:hypothetical protein
VSPKNRNQLDQTLIRLVQTKKPTSVQQLIDLAKSETTFIAEKEILEHVIRLQDQGQLKLKEPLAQASLKLSAYLKTTKAAWYWITIILSIVTALTVFIIPENSYPLTYIRNILGTIFVLCLPGYTLIKALFPTQVPIKTTTESLDTIERIALSIGVSLALVPLVGLFLNYTPWGIRLTPIVLSLFTLTVIFATTALVREHQTKQKTQT